MTMAKNITTPKKRTSAQSGSRKPAHSMLLSSLEAVRMAKRKDAWQLGQTSDNNADGRLSVSQKWD
jgi:hypothetical protein